jgi:hypothetical protein
MTERELDKKYPVGTPDWRKNEIERYVCKKHGLRTILIRDAEIAVHINFPSKCS